jgi:hypothetical protein
MHADKALEGIRGKRLMCRRPHAPKTIKQLARCFLQWKKPQKNRKRFRFFKRLKKGRFVAISAVTDNPPAACCRFKGRKGAIPSGLCVLGGPQ